MNQIEYRPVELIVGQLGVLKLFDPELLLAAIASVIPAIEESVCCSISFETNYGKRSLDFTIRGDGGMHETYGSRPVLDFDLLLSRIHWG
ncbi:hypothetical protein [Cellvibrio sp. QJXJ]|uniref:hypothetical protein n=1 Tax=Cellvibrio sp. QJXJ TaxID=2964606 RepID=UPI0021C4C54B|nr:hypothetical protein [Cellvibrio sp. QJXJ]UUA75214.1 hypothetical protein NNX04_22410 [Cellvibrio sp. QJXJ]